MNEIFTSITLSNGSKCDILELKASMIWKATFKQMNNLQMEYDLIPFLLEQILIIDGEKTDMEFIGNMNYDDYMDITEVLNVFMTKLGL